MGPEIRQARSILFEIGTYDDLDDAENPPEKIKEPPDIVPSETKAPASKKS